METYSLSLGSNSVVSPNVALQAVLLSSGDTVGSTGVRFTLQKGKLFVSCARNSRERSTADRNNVLFLKI